MKKILIGAASVAMLLGTVAPTFAQCCPPPRPPRTVEINNTVSVSGSKVNVAALSGLNKQTAPAPATQDMTIGNVSAMGMQSIVANTGGCGCPVGNICDCKANLTITNNTTVTESNLNVAALSGLNTQEVTATKDGLGGGQCGRRCCHP